MRFVIAASSYYPEINGGSTNLHRRLELLSTWGHDVLLLAPDYASVDVYTPEECKKYVGQVFPRVQVVPFPAYQLFLSKGMSPSMFAISRMAHVIRAFKPDIIQIESPERLFYGSLEVPGLGIAQELGVPIIGVHHTNYVRTLMHYRREPGFKQIAAVPGVLAMLQGMMKWIYNSYAVGLTDTEVAAASLREYAITTAEKAGFLGLDLNLFNDKGPKIDDPRIAKFGDRFRLIHVGRVTPDKYFDVVFAAMDLVEQRRPGKVALMVVGGGFPSLERQLQAREGPSLAWFGFVDNNLLPPYYRTADAFVTAAPDETAGLVVMEAMACGLPCLGPNCGGVGEFIKSGVSGLSYPRGDVAAMADAIIRFVDDADLRARLAAGAKEAASHFSVEAGTRRVEAIAKRVVASHKPAPVAWWRRRGGLRWGLYFTFFLWVNAMGWLGIYVFRLVKRRWANAAPKQPHGDAPKQPAGK